MKPVSRPRRTHLALLTILVVGLLLRILPAPISSGSDLAQFAGFADSFLRHGACFYKYALGSSWEKEGWPYNWPYVYGPIWIMILGIIRLVVPQKITMYWENEVYHVFLPASWITAVKAVLIAGDVASAVLIYVLVKRRFGGKWGVLSTALYFLSPTTIYVSSIYGMFDQVALALLLASIVVAEQNPLASGILAAYSFLTKQVVAPPLLGLLLYWSQRRSFRLRIFLLGFLIGVLVAIGPFVVLCPSSMPELLRSMTAAPHPGPVEPLSYNFNGISSIATYLHDKRGLDNVLALIKYWWIMFLALIIPVLYRLLSSRNISLYKYMASLYLVFIATYWRVNYQYMVVLIALIALVLPYTRLCGKLTLTQLYIVINSWVFIYPLSWWFHVHIRMPDREAWSMVDKLTLMVFDDAFYVAYAMGLTFTAITTLLCMMLEDHKCS